MRRVRHRQTLARGVPEYGSEGGRWAYVDDGILSLVTLLNELGMSTSQSCQGELGLDSPRRKRRDAYIDFLNADDAVFFAYLASSVSGNGSVGKSVGITLRPSPHEAPRDLTGKVSFDPRLIKVIESALRSEEVKAETPEVAHKTRGSLR